MKVHLLSISLGLLSISLSAQNTVWHERLDSSYIEATRVRPESAIIPIKPADLRMTASPMGEADPVKYIQTLPGVSTGMEGSSAYYVRGGNGGNNLTTLDGIPIYGAGHLLGLTTAYPSDIVSRNDFYAGGFPSDAGGFTSSLLQLTTADGDYQKAHGSFFINNFLLGARADGPLKKDKVSVLTSVRISPIGLEYNLLRPHLDKSLSLPDRINALVGDAFVKISWKTGSRGRMFFSTFGSYDRYAFDPTELSSQALGWSNLIANLSWQQETLSGWKWEARLSHNGFRAFQDQSQSKSVSGKVITTRMSVESALMEEGLETKVSKRFGYGLEFQTGLDAFVSFFQPGVSKVYLDDENEATAGHPLTTVRSSLHGQVRYGNGPFHASAGARLTAFFSDGYKTVRPIASLLVSYQFLPSFLLKATYDHSVQFFHSLEGIPTGWSMEMLIPSTGQNQPETADQAWAGMEFSKGSFFLSAGGFYKDMKGLVFFADASSFFNSAWSAWQYNLESGTGHSYGLELMSRWESPRVAGQLSYTLSKTDRVFSSLNFGHPIPFKFDRRHMLNLTGEFKLAQGKKATHSLTGGLSFMSGHWETVKSGTYPIYSLGSDEKRESREADYTSHPNNLQLPAYFRMDAGYHLTIQGQKTRHELSVGVYNLTNRHNAYSLTWDSEDARWKKLSIFPILPNFTYRMTL
ncbi:MAG: TonB-dependent receptor [Bacteroidales bacterium]|nr:TonB-dependent receptor [Bacteroidales bacterium]